MVVRERQDGGVAALRNDRDLYPQEQDKLTLAGAVIMVAAIILAVGFVILISTVS